MPLSQANTENKTILRIWDVYLFEGSYVLLLIGLAIFKMYEDKLMAIDDNVDVSMFLTSQTPTLFDCHQLLKVIDVPSA